MSYEMKDILKTMIDNNEPHWSADTMEMVRAEIDHVYSQAAKAEEYEVKAKAFDEVLKSFDESISEGRMADDVCNIVNKFRGEQ